MSDTPETNISPLERAFAPFVNRLRALSTDPAQLTEALQSKSLEQVVNGMLAETCEAEGVPVSEFFHAFERDRAAQRQLEGLMRGLMNSPVVMEARRPALLRDVHRELLLLEFALSGEEPPPGTWDGIEPSEQQRVRHAAMTMKGTDAALLARVRSVLARAEFGTCADCGGPIPVGRLQLIAAAERCAPCQSKLEPAEPEASIAAQVQYFPRRA